MLLTVYHLVDERGIIVCLERLSCEGHMRRSQQTLRPSQPKLKHSQQS
jgi:hypothetical protein